MPKRIERNTGLTEGQKEVLLTGSGWLALAGTWSDDAMRDAWAECEDELLAEWLLDPDNLFKRPWAWWQYGGHRRGRIRGEAQDYDSIGERVLGVPTDYTDQELEQSTMAEIEYKGRHPFFETEKDFLLRNPKLLLPAERNVTKLIQ